MCTVNYSVQYTLYLDAGIRDKDEAGLHTVLVVGHRGLDGARRDVIGAVQDQGGKGAGLAGLEVHQALAEQTGVSSGVGGQAEDDVEELQVRGQRELDLFEIHQLDDGTQVVVRLGPALAMGQNQDTVDPRVELSFLLSQARFLGSRVPGQF